MDDMVTILTKNGYDIGQLIHGGLTQILRFLQRRKICEVNQINFKLDVSNFESSEIEGLNHLRSRCIAKYL